LALARDAQSKPMRSLSSILDGGERALGRV
jgi:hypothetical protein